MNILSVQQKRVSRGIQCYARKMQNLALLD